jgi:hypothetical protein
VSGQGEHGLRREALLGAGKIVCRPRNLPALI